MNEEKCNVLPKEQKNNNSCKELALKDINAFVKARFTEVKKSNKIKELVSFQSTNKFFIMVRSQEELKILGRIVASNNKSNLPEILSEYEKHLNIVLMLCPQLKHIVMY